MSEVLRETKKNRKGVAISTNLDYLTHIHSNIEMIYVKKGSSTAYYNGREFKLKSGDFFTVFPNQIHSYEKSENGIYYVMIVNPYDLLQYESVFFDNLPESPLLNGNTPEGEKTAMFIQTFHSEVDDADGDIIADYLTLIFGKLLKMYTLIGNKTNIDRISEVLNYCIKNHNTEISLTSTAQALNLSKSYLSYIFGKKLSVNFCDYINSLRVNDAKKLLESEKYTVAEIADMTGFNTIRTFNSAFLKNTGVSPTAYRKSLKNAKN